MEEIMTKVEYVVLDQKIHGDGDGTSFKQFKEMLLSAEKKIPEKYLDYAEFEISSNLDYDDCVEYFF